MRGRPTSTLFPYTTLFRSLHALSMPGSFVLALAFLVASAASAALPIAPAGAATQAGAGARSEEHTSELQPHVNLVFRLLLKKKNIHTTNPTCLARQPALVN